VILKNICLLLSFFLLIPPVLYAAADLELQEVQGNLEQNGKQLHLILSLRNLGPDEAANLACRIRVDAGKGMSWSREVRLKPLAVASSSRQEIQLQPEVPYVSSVLVEVFDLDQPDLVPSSNSKIWVPGKPADLLIEEASIAEQQPVSGRTISLNLKLRNLGPAAVSTLALQASLMVYQEAIATIEKKGGSLEANEEREVKLQISLLKTMIPATEGTIEIHVASGTSDIYDPREQNNAYLLPVALTLRMPDLMVRNAQVNQYGSLTFSIVNNGNAPCDATTTLLYVNGALAKRYNTPELRPGAEKRHQYGGTKIIPGTQIAIVADFNADVTESSEENNRFTFTVKR
jgi:hypothetical protein